MHDADNNFCENLRQNFHDCETIKTDRKWMQWRDWHNLIFSHFRIQSIEHSHTRVAAHASISQLDKQSMVDVWKWKQIVLNFKVLFAISHDIDAWANANIDDTVSDFTYEHLHDTHKKIYDNNGSGSKGRQKSWKVENNIHVFSPFHMSSERKTTKIDKAIFIAVA